MSPVVICYEPGSPAYEEAAKGLSLLVKNDGLRDGGHRWTVAIQGVARGDGDSPEAAAAVLLGRLRAMAAKAGS